MATIKASAERLDWSYGCPLSHFMTSLPLKENPTAESWCGTKRLMGVSRMLMQIQDIIFCFCELILIQCSRVLGNVWMTQFGDNRLQPTLEILFYKMYCCRRTNTAKLHSFLNQWKWERWFNQLFYGACVYWNSGTKAPRWELIRQ